VTFEVSSEVRLIVESDICGDVAYDSQIQQQLWRLSLNLTGAPDLR